MANLESNESATSSVEHLNKLLQSSNVKDKSTAIATLSELSHDDNIVQDMLQCKLHVNLLLLLGEEDIKKAKLSPHLINEVLQILNVMVRSYDFCASDDDETSVSSDPFRGVLSLLNHTLYKEVCQNNVYSLIEAAGDYRFVIDSLDLELPKSTKAWSAFLSLFAQLSIVEFSDEYLQKMMQSKLFHQISAIAKGQLTAGDLAQVHCFEILWNLRDETQKWDCCTDLFCRFIENSLSKKRSQDIHDEITQLTNQITNDMEGKWANKKDKGANGVAAHGEDLQKWSTKQNALTDKLHSIRLTLDLYLQIFEHETTQHQHKYNACEEEQEDRWNYSCILPKASINKVIALILNYWIDKEFDIGHLVNVSASVGMDLYVADLLKTLTTKQINMICEITSASMISISCSEWQCLWDVLLKRIGDETGDNVNANDLDRDDGNISNILHIAISENSKELQITKSNVNALLKLHSRVRNAQQLATQFNMQNMNGTDAVFESKDLRFVGDINAFQLHLNELFVALFKTQIIESNKEYQRSILNALYDDVEMLCNNIQFVDILSEYQKNKRKEVTEDTGHLTFAELFEEWGTSFQDALQIGCEIAQLILDVMSMNDEYAKLAINKKRFRSILKLYNMVESKWLKCKEMVDFYNATNRAKSEDFLIDWEHVDNITQPVKECIVNIEDFIRY